MFKKRQILSPAITEHQGLLGAKDRITGICQAIQLSLTGNSNKISGGLDVAIATSCDQQSFELDGFQGP
jgi:hypothetical protein